MQSGGLEIQTLEEIIQAFQCEIIRILMYRGCQRREFRNYTDNVSGCFGLRAHSTQSLRSLHAALLGGRVSRKNNEQA
ncbi:hypothetical protein BFN10_10905 [Pseudomonas extremorientalis]|uniref:Uncharacterized protein n=1 Tax=Pseudomonas extremorientalis TaxID=169669 RepID=A0A1S2TL12_9PSED|nr:hypothetical protein BFN10_10905 [Pseudomonas extremorientalis]